MKIVLGAIGVFVFLLLCFVVYYEFNHESENDYQDWGDQL